MSSDELNTIYKKIESLKNAANQPLTSMGPQETTVRLIPDESVAPSKFKPSVVDPNIYYATKVTISAVKKEIFLVGDGFEDLENLKQCSSCARDIDAQFWKFCPFCEGKLLK